VVCRKESGGAVPSSDLGARVVAEAAWNRRRWMLYVRRAGEGKEKERERLTHGPHLI
jgi:hypothetical protein